MKSVLLLVSSILSVIQKSFYSDSLSNDHVLTLVPLTTYLLLSIIIINSNHLQEPLPTHRFAFLVLSNTQLFTIINTIVFGISRLLSGICVDWKNCCCERERERKRSVRMISISEIIDMELYYSFKMKRCV